MEEESSKLILNNRDLNKRINCINIENEAEIKRLTNHAEEIKQNFNISERNNITLKKDNLEKEEEILKLSNKIIETNKECAGLNERVFNLESQLDESLTINLMLEEKCKQSEEKVKKLQEKLRSIQCGFVNPARFQNFNTPESIKKKKNSDNESFFDESTKKTSIQNSGSGIETVVDRRRNSWRFDHLQPFCKINGLPDNRFKHTTKISATNWRAARDYQDKLLEDDFTDVTFLSDSK
jgi:DNA repair exonuclease SbcCD ATPase subunit